MRITLIHALRHSPPPIEAAFARLWPQARLRHLLDDGLSADLAAAGGPTPAMTDRFLRLTDYALRTGAEGILFTCSAFGRCIEACQAAHPDVPIMKPNQAMIDEACAAAGSGGAIGLLASFEPTLSSMVREFPPGLRLRTAHAPGALDALDQGDGARHDRLAALAARGLADCEVVALAQFSLARAAEAVGAATGRPVLTTPDCAVRGLRARMSEGAACPA